MTAAPGGRARSGGPSVQELLRADGEDVPDVLRLESDVVPPVVTVPIERYVSADYHQREVEHVWRRVWQMACREEELPDTGDMVVYDVADISILVVRGDDGRLRAFHNSCLHKGTQLRSSDGAAPELRCPFHGWTWRLDGTLARVPSAWDFPGLDPDRLCLPQAQVDTWGGFVFVNLDLDAGPLHEWLAPLPEHFTRWPLAERHKVAHVASVVPCNWKVALEAFLEGYHAPTTHPQMAWYAGDENSQYDIFGPNVSRIITVEAVPSPALRTPPSEAEILAALAGDLGVGGPDAAVPEGRTARQVAGEHMRAAIARASGVDTSGACTSELLDAIQYWVFPNLVPWGGYSPLCYRFRPWGSDPNQCVAEVMVLALLPPGAARPRPKPVRWLTSDDWREAPELGAVGHVLNQDMFNLPKVQRGLRSAAATGRTEIRLAEYQELRVRQLHARLTELIGS